MKGDDEVGLGGCWNSKTLVSRCEGWLKVEGVGTCTNGLKPDAGELFF
jgi:hypothetical protein